MIIQHADFSFNWNSMLMKAKSNAAGNLDDLNDTVDPDPVIFMRVPRSVLESLSPYLKLGAVQFAVRQVTPEEVSDTDPLIFIDAVGFFSQPEGSNNAFAHFDPPECELFVSDSAVRVIQGAAVLASIARRMNPGLSILITAAQTLNPESGPCICLKETTCA